jgi:hypothetical protein
MVRPRCGPAVAFGARPAGRPTDRLTTTALLAGIEEEERKARKAMRVELTRQQQAKFKDFFYARVGFPPVAPTDDDLSLSDASDASLQQMTPSNSPSKFSRSAAIHPCQQPETSVVAEELTECTVWHSSTSCEFLAPEDLDEEGSSTDVAFIGTISQSSSRKLLFDLES